MNKLKLEQLVKPGIKKNTNICLVLPSLGAGGMERVMSILATYLGNISNYTVTLILLTNGEDFFRLPESVKIVKPDFDHKNYNRFSFTIKTFIYLRRQLKKYKPDTVLSFGGKYNAFVILAGIGLGLNIFVSDRSRPGISYGKFFDFLNPVLYKKVKGIIAQTAKAKAFTFQQTGHQNIQIIGNPVREIFAPDIQKENIILNVGRFIKSKKQDWLIDYFSSLKASDWKLVFVGEGKEMEACQKYAEASGCADHIIFMGNQKDVDTIYNKSKIFAFTSLSEGFPNVLAEAMSAGLACISFDCTAGPSDLIEDGINGFLIPEGDHDLYKKKLNLLIQDEKTRADFGKKALQTMQKFRAESIAQKFEQFMLS